MIEHLIEYEERRGTLGQLTYKFVTLRAALGEFPAGSHFGWAVVDIVAGVLVLGDGEPGRQERGRFRLKLTAEPLPERSGVAR